MYRLVVEFILTDEQNESIKKAKEMVDFLRLSLADKTDKPEIIKYQLRNDSDRRNKNYLDLDSEKHASSSKSNLFE